MAMLAKYDDMHPSLRPLIPFTQLKEAKYWYEALVDYSMGKDLYFIDGNLGLVYNSYLNKGKEIITRVRPATYSDAIKVRPLSSLIGRNGIYYTGVGGISRRGISYTSLKSNPYITIPIEPFFAENRYTYPASEGKRGNVLRAPYMFREEDILFKSSSYKVHTSYVLPSSEAWESLFEAVYNEQLSRLTSDEEVVRILQGMAYLLTPFLYVRMACDSAVRLVKGWSEGFVSYILNVSYEELLDSCSSISNSANSKIELLFDRVYGKSAGQVLDFNNSFKAIHLRFIEFMFASASNQNLSSDRNQTY